MRNDREIACDTSVLKMLEEDDYEDYGNTLINFIEKVSFSPFPFAANLSGNMKQMKRRIINIASYEKPTFCKKLKGHDCFYTDHSSNNGTYTFYFYICSGRKSLPMEIFLRKYFICRFF